MEDDEPTAPAGRTGAGQPSHAAPLPTVRPATDWPVVVLVQLIGVLALGAGYLTAPDGVVADDGILALYPLVALVVGACSFTVVASRRARFLLGVAAALAPVPVVVLARVALDVAADPTSHNLWPFEVIIAVVVSLPPALAGALLGLPVRSVAARWPDLARGRR